MKYLYHDQPFLIYWEITRSCDLACKHCRAEAIPQRHPLELKDAECIRLLHDIKEFGGPGPELVITGGDPLKHPSLFMLLQYAKNLGIKVSLSPSGTPNLTREAFQRFKEMNIRCLSLSIDRATREAHDNFRGVAGCWDWTMKAVEYAHEAGIPFQINSLVSGDTMNEMEDMYELVKTLGAIRWSVFFLISVGRGTALEDLTPEKAEDIMHWLGEVSKDAPFAIKTTEAPHFRRVMIQRAKTTDPGRAISGLPVSRGFGIRDGNGIMFISHTGEVFPSGFLPKKAGTVRKNSLAEIYRYSDLFQDLRQPDKYIGKCGYCEFRQVCGGSRARAYAATGNPMESDPLCSYEPVKKEIPEEGVI